MGSLHQQFLYYAMLEINDYAEMKKVVGQMHGPSIYDWLNAVQSRFGVDYYNQLVDDLMEDFSMERWTYKLNEQQIYACPPQRRLGQRRRGSSRLGLEERNLVMVETEYHISDYNYITENGDSVLIHDYSTDSIRYLYRGDKRYELSNHLGNVLAVITDRRIQACGMGEVMYPACRSAGLPAAGRYEAQVVSITDYYPGGMQIKERSWSSNSYRFGFNGKEQNLEFGETVYDYGFRIYDSRIVRFLSVDPIAISFPYYSPYQFAGNRLIWCLDLDGLEDIDYNLYIQGMLRGETQLRFCLFPPEDPSRPGRFTLALDPSNPFWTIKNGKYVVKDNVDPSDAIRHIYNNPQLYQFDCGFFVQAVKLYGMLEAMGDDAFDAYMREFPEQFTLDNHGSTGIVYNDIYEFDPDSRGKKLQSINGSYVRTKKVLRQAAIGTEIAVKASFNDNTVFATENIVKVGDNQYLAQGLGTGPMTLEQVKWGLVQIGVDAGKVEDTKRGRKKAYKSIIIQQVKTSPTNDTSGG